MTSTNMRILPGEYLFLPTNVDGGNYYFAIKKTAISDFLRIHKKNNDSAIFKWLSQATREDLLSLYDYGLLSEHIPFIFYDDQLQVINICDDSAASALMGFLGDKLMEAGHLNAATYFNTLWK